MPYYTFCWDIYLFVYKVTFKKLDNQTVRVLNQVIPSWKKMYATAKLVGVYKKDKQELWVPAVFQTMFYHIGLHLFKEAMFATDVLQVITDQFHNFYKLFRGTFN